MFTGTLQLCFAYQPIKIHQRINKNELLTDVNKKKIEKRMKSNNAVMTTNIRTDSLRNLTQ